MADNMTQAVLSVIATTGSRLPDLAIQDGQLIFVRDRRKIAFDFKGQRTFYHQIMELDTDLTRQELEDPEVGFYFVVSTAVLWRYETSGWIQLTSEPQDVLCIGVELPELGNPQTLYVDKTNRQIAVWEEDVSAYLVVSDKTAEISADDIAALFS